MGFEAVYADESVLPGRNAIVEHDVKSRSSFLMEGISASTSKPLGLVLDANCSSLYIADSGSHRVLKHTFSSPGGVEVVIGTGTAGQLPQPRTAGDHYSHVHAWPGKH